MRRICMSITCMVFLMACSMPETQIYSLHLQGLSGKGSVGRGSEDVLKPDRGVAITISAPRYLSQPYVAYRTSPYHLVLSRYAKWDSPPEEILKGAFKDACYSSGLFKEVRTSGIVPGGFYSLVLNLKGFERIDDGTVSRSELVFDALFLSPEGTELFRTNIAKKTQLADQSLVSLAQGLSGSLTDGIDEVVGRMEKSLKR